MYNKEATYKKVLLEQIYVNLWEPLLVVLTKEIYYFMLIMDSISSFWYIEFLKEKSIEMTLKVLKNFMTEIEKLIEQKLMRMRVNYGQEWDN